MNSHQPATLAFALGRRLRAIRDERGETADQIAAEARRVGLAWRQSTVARIENGTRGLSAEELVLLPTILDVPLTELLAGVDETALTPTLTVDGEALTRMLAADATVGDLGQERDVAAMIADGLDTMHQVTEILGGDTPVDVVKRVERDAAGDAEQRAGRALDVPAVVVSAVAHRRWGRGLTAERDARVADRAEAGASSRSLQAIRGHVTRELLDDLAADLDQAAGRTGG